MSTTIRVSRGTLLYRAAATLEEFPEPEICQDTDKYGVYFSTHWWLSAAMVLEYGRSLELGVYVLTKDINVLYGKYSFRYLTMDKFFDAEGNLRPNVPLDPIHNQSHFDPSAIPTEQIPVPASWDRDGKDGQVFVSDRDLHAVQYVNTVHLEYNHTRQVLEHGDDLTLSQHLESSPRNRGNVNTTLCEQANELRDHVLSFLANTYVFSWERGDNDLDLESYRDTALETAKRLRQDAMNYTTSFENKTGVCYAISVLNLFLRLDTIWDYLDAFRKVDYPMIRSLLQLRDRLHATNEPYISFPSDLIVCDLYGGGPRFFSKLLVSKIAEDLYDYYQTWVTTPFDMTLHTGAMNMDTPSADSTRQIDQEQQQQQYYMTLSLSDTDSCRRGTARNFMDGLTLPLFDLEECILRLFDPLPFGFGYQFIQTPRLLMFVIDYEVPDITRPSGMYYTCHVPRKLFLPVGDRDEWVSYDVRGVLFAMEDDEEGHSMALIREKKNDEKEQEWLYDNEGVYKNPLRVQSEYDYDADAEPYSLAYAAERGLRWFDQPLSADIIVYERVETGND
jgi:hypothetical protein